jgi:hypothetical protein
MVTSSMMAHQPFTNVSRGKARMARRYMSRHFEKTSKTRERASLFGSISMHRHERDAVSQIENEESKDMPSLPCTINFGFDRDYKLWAAGGWSDDPNDRTHTWANGHVAKLRLVLEYAKGDRLLQIDVVPYEAMGITQEMFVFLNGGFVSMWSVKSSRILSARIEAALFTAGENVFAFAAPKAICPKEAGLGSDQRTLSFAFRSLSLSEA